MGIVIEKAKAVMFMTHCIQEVSDLTKISKKEAEPFVFAFNTFLQEARLAGTAMPLAVAELCLNILEHRDEVIASTGEAAEKHITIATAAAKKIVATIPGSPAAKGLQEALAKNGA